MNYCKKNRIQSAFNNIIDKDKIYSNIKYIIITSFSMFVFFGWEGVGWGSMGQVEAGWEKSGQVGSSCRGWMTDSRLGERLGGIAARHVH